MVPPSSTRIIVLEAEWTHPWMKKASSKRRKPPRTSHERVSKSKE
jgi:hypothetical protein